MVAVADRKASGTEFEAAQHWARLAEAAHRDALAQLDNAMAIRLQLLADRLRTELAADTPLTGPVVVAGGRPRLWVDLVLFVEMAPEPRTYQLTLEGAHGREVLCETSDVADMAARIGREIAHLRVARQQAIASAMRDSRAPRTYSAASLLVSWLAGLTAGVLALLAYLIHLKLL